MSALKINSLQIGQSLTAANNFTWYQPSTPDGTVRLGNGNPGSVTDLVTLTSSGNFGIGTSSPGSKLDVKSFGDTPIRLETTGGSSVYLQFTNTTGGAYIGSSGNGLGFYTSGSATLRATLNSSGNLGLGVTPSAWHTLSKAFQFGSTAAFENYNNVSNNSFLNVYRNSSGQFVYLTSAAASLYGQYQGAHSWYTAPSGTEGNAISFTQAMTLDASGNLGIGTTNPGYALEVHKSVMIRGNDPSTTGEYQDWPECSFNIRRSDNYAVNGITMASFGYRSDPSYFSDNSICNIRIWDATQAASASTSASTTKMTLGSPGAISLITGNSVERLIIDSSGRLSTPYQPFLFGRISGSPNTYQTMNVQQSRNASVSTANGVTNSRFTAQIAGVYSLKLNTIFNTSTGRNDIRWYKNGGGVAASLNEDNGTGYHYRTIAIDIYLSVNDYVEIVNGSGNTIYNGGAWDTEWTSFSITFMG